MAVQGQKGFHAWSAHRKQKMAANFPRAQQRRIDRRKAQEAAHAANVASGVSPWQRACEARAQRRLGLQP